VTLELEERHGTILSKSVHVAVFGILERKAIPPTDSKINLYIAQYQVLNQVTKFVIQSNTMGYTHHLGIC